jgi:hypothetical protein
MSISIISVTRITKINKKKKELAWREIAETLTTTVPMYQKEWKNLRDRFNKENKTRSGAKAPASEWAYCAAMLFYGKYSKHRATSIPKVFSITWRARDNL